MDAIRASGFISKFVLYKKKEEVKNEKQNTLGLRARAWFALVARSINYDLRVRYIIESVEGLESRGQGGSGIERGGQAWKEPRWYLRGAGRSRCRSGPALPRHSSVTKHKTNSNSLAVPRSVNRY